MNFVTLQISFSYWNDHQYAITFARTSADDEGEARADFQVPRAKFEPAAFLVHVLDPEKYGQALSDLVFQDPTANKIFVDACAKANNPKDPVPLRVQLVLNPQMADLHELQWETLRHPETKLPLFVRDDMLFSRYLWSDDTRPIRARGRDDLRALVGVAVPDDLEKYELAPIDEAAELDRIRKALAAADIDPKILNNPAGEVSPGAIIDELRATRKGTTSSTWSATASWPTGARAVA